jgi:hypothetical protein
MKIRSITSSGDFAQTNTCSTQLLGRSTCTISITCTPLQSGPLTGSINISDTAGDGPQHVGLTLVPAAPATTLTVSSRASTPAPLPEKAALSANDGSLLRRHQTPRFSSAAGGTLLTVSDDLVSGDQEA